MARANQLPISLQVPRCYSASKYPWVAATTGMEEYRQRIIAVRAEDLRRVAETYLKPEQASTAIVTGNHGMDEAKQLGLEIIQV